MPVMIVGADTPQGSAITERLYSPEREVRVFVTDFDAAKSWRSRGVKVAQGDVSDDTHVGAACLNCFSVVLVGEAATDRRERSVAASAGGVLESWAKAVESANVRRVIWVTEDEPPPIRGPEIAVVDPADDELANKVFQLDEVREL